MLIYVNLDIMILQMIAYTKQKKSFYLPELTNLL